MKSRLFCVKIQYAAFATISGLRDAAYNSGGKFILIADVAIVVFGHSELIAIPAFLNSADMPNVQTLIPYLE